MKRAVSFLAMSCVAVPIGRAAGAVIRYEVTQGRAGGSDWSVFHAPKGNKMSGDAVWWASGTFDLEQTAADAFRFVELNLKLYEFTYSGDPGAFDNAEIGNVSLDPLAGSEFRLLGPKQRPAGDLFVTVNLADGPVGWVHLTFEDKKYNALANSFDAQAVYLWGRTPVGDAGAVRGLEGAGLTSLGINLAGVAMAPEPALVALLGSAFVPLLLVRRRRRR